MKKRSISLLLCFILIFALLTAVSITVYAENGAATPTPTPAPVPGAPVITKSPTDETVEVGGSAVFTADADNATWWAWRFIRGTETVIFDVVDNRFPGLKIEGGNDKTFKLTNIPKELDGWDVACIFGNAGPNMTLSATARITVTDQATPAPTETPAPTPTATPEPTPTIAPTETPAPTPTATPEPIPTPTVKPDLVERLAGDSTPLLLIILALVVLLIVLVVILLLRQRRVRRDEFDDYDDYDDSPRGRRR